MWKPCLSETKRMKHFNILPLLFTIRLLAASNCFILIPFSPLVLRISMINFPFDVEAF